MVKKLVAVFLTLLFCAGIAFGLPALVSQAQAAAPLEEAQAKVEQAGSYRFSSSMQQTMLPLASPEMIGQSSQLVEMRAEGQVVAPDSSYLQLSFPGSPETPALGILQNGAESFILDGTQLRRVDNPAGMAAPDGDVFVWLRAARNVTAIEAIQTAAGTFSRYRFDVDGPELARYLAAQTEKGLGADKPSDLHIAPSEMYMKMSGSGELWIGADGLPVRQVLDLEFPEVTEQYGARLHMVSDFSNYAQVSSYPAPWQAEDGSWQLRWLTVNPARARGANSAPWSAEFGGLLAACASIAGMALLYRRQRRMVSTTISILLVLSFCLSPLMESFRYVRLSDRLSAVENPLEVMAEVLQTPLQSASQQASALHPAPLFEGRSPQDLSARLEKATAQSCGSGSTSADTDGDTINDAAEYCLGTDPFQADSDRDLIRDDVEITGFEYNGKRWYGNPFDVDTNHDGKADVVEWPAAYGGEAPSMDADSDGIPNLWDDDNDGDGVPDRVDLSPYSYSTYSDKFTLTTQNDYDGYLYIDLQIQPLNPDELRYHNSILDWPSDSEGQLRDRNNSSQDIRLIPYLDVYANQFPSAELQKKYGITLFRPQGQPATSHHMYVPLMPVGDGTQNSAYYARVAYDPGMIANLQWRDARVVWMAQVYNDYDGFDQLSPLVAYTGGNFRLSGMQVVKSGEIEALLLTTPDQPNDDRQLFNLIFGLSATYLRNQQPNQQEVFNRFDGLNTEEQYKWGVTTDVAMLHTTYAHTDASVAGLSEDLKNLFSTYYSTSDTPSVAIALEYTSGAFSLDDLQSLTVSPNQTLNMNLIRVDTSRSLKLGLYQHVAGSWQQLSAEDLVGELLERYDDLSGAMAELSSQYPDLTEDDLRGVMLSFYIIWSIGQTYLIRFGGQNLAPAQRTDQDIFDAFALPGINSLPAYMIEAAKLAQRDGGLRTGGSQLEAWEYQRQYELLTEDVGEVSGFQQIVANAKAFFTDETNMRLMKTFKALLTTALAIRTAYQAATWATAVVNSVRVGGWDKMMGLSSRTLGVVGMVVAIVLTWVIFALTTDFSNPIALTTAIIYAVLSTILSVVLFVVSLNPIGAIVVAVFMIVELLCMLISLGEFSLIDTIISGVTEFFYSGEYLTEFDDAQFHDFDTSLIYPDKGMVTGNIFRIQATFHGWMRAINGGDSGDLYDSYIYGTMVGVKGGAFWTNKNQTSGVESVTNNRLHSYNTAAVEFTLPAGTINHVLSTQSYIYVKARMEECVFLGICWKSNDYSTYPNDIENEADRWDPSEMTLDVLPDSLQGMMTWSALTQLDSDGDKLLNSQEGSSGLGTSASLWDSDSDGLSDYFEYMMSREMGTNPLVADVDGDGLKDGFELNHDLAINNTDTDGDGLNDNLEFYNPRTDGSWDGGWDVSLPGMGNSVRVFSNPLQPDLDDDGINDLAEKQNGTSPYAANLSPQIDLTAAPYVTGSGGRAGVYVHPGDTISLNLGVYSVGPRAVTSALELCLPDFATQISGGSLTGSRTPPPEAPAACTQGLAWDFSASNTLQRWEQAQTSLTFRIDPGLSQTAVAQIVLSLPYLAADGQPQIITSVIPVVVDLSAPQVFFSAPSDGQILGGGVTEYVVGGSAQDEHSWVTQVEVNLPGMGTSTAEGISPWAKTWSLPADGEYTLYAWAHDYMENMSSQVTIEVMVDNTPPEVSTSLADGSYVGGDIQAETIHLALSGAAHDDTSGLIRVEISLDGQPWRAVWADDGTHPMDVTWNETWEMPNAPSAQGYHTLRMRAYDRAGNLSDILDRWILVDVTPPTSYLTDNSMRTDQVWLPALQPATLRGIANEGGNLPLPARPVELVGQLQAMQDATIWLGMPSLLENDAGVKAAWLGDMNGDRLADLGLGLPAGNEGRGRLAIVYGKAGGWPLPPETYLLSQADTSFIGVDGAGLGEYFAPAGDVDGDGLADLLVGDPLNNRVFLVFGRAGATGSDLLLDGPNSGAWSLLQAAPGETIGEWFSGAGDFNGDGNEDILVGATGGDGRAYLLLGKSEAWEETVDIPTFAAAIFEYPGGAPLAGVGNLDGDFYSDLSISSGNTLYLFMGNAGVARSGLREVALAEADASLSASLAGANPIRLGDINADGMDDFIFRNGDAPRLVFGAANRSFTWRDLSGWQPLPNGFVAAPGDVNSDGTADLLIGNAAQDAYLILGTPDLSAASRLPEISATIAQVADAASSPYASAADLNSDGSSDLLLLPYMAAGLDVTSYPQTDFIPPQFLPSASSRTETAPVKSQAAKGSLTVDDDGCGGCYPTIQAAVDAATAGDTIQVKPGVYAPFSIAGKDGLQVIGIHPDAVFVDGAGAPIGIQVSDAVSVGLKNLTVRNVNQAIVLVNAGQGGVATPTLQTTIEKILVYDYQENALVMDHTSTARISQSTLSGDGGHLQVSGEMDPSFQPSWSDATSPSVPTLADGGDLFSLNDELYLVRGGGSPTIDVYDRTSSSWSTLTTPGNFGANSATTIGPDGKIWAYQVNGVGNYKLYLYDGSTWDERANLITYGYEHAGAGAAIVTTAGGQPYMIRGNSSNHFYIYWGPNVGFPDGYWNSAPGLPGAVGAGGALVDATTPDGEFLYALRGNATSDFYRYDLVSQTWSSMAPVTDPLTGTSYAVGGGASLAWDGKDYIYAVTGGNGRAFLRYSIPGNRWELLGDGLTGTTDDEDVPLPINPGGGITYFDLYMYAAPGGGVNRALLRYGPFDAQPPAKLYLDRVAFIAPENLVDIAWMNLDPNAWPVDFRVDGLDNSWVGGPATQWSPYPYDMPLLCQNQAASGLPTHYEGYGGLEHTLTFPDNYFIADLNIQDLSFYGTPNLRETFLTAPWGQTITLFSYLCGASPVDVQIDLDDEAVRGLMDDCNQWASQPYVPGAAYRPQTPLSALDGHTSAGTWKLTINRFNGGWNYVDLNGWGVEVCHGAAILTHAEARLLDPAQDVYRVGEGSRLLSGYHTYRADAVVAASGAEFSDIQEAILSGANRVLLRAGNYAQPFYLVSGVQVIGSGAETSLISAPAGSFSELVSAEGVVGAGLSRVRLEANASLNGFYAEGGARNTTFSRNIVRNAVRGILTDGAGTHIEVFNNTLVNNEGGMQVTACANLDVRNTIFADSSGYGLQFTDCSPTRLHTYNDYWNNGQDLEPLEPGPGEIFMDPQFISPLLENYRTRDHSPVADAGNPSDPVPPGAGERADIGYLEQGRASFYVDDDYCPDCVNDYLTWEVDAFQTIQDGLEAARTYIQDIGYAPEDPVVVGVGAGEYIEPAEVPSYVHLAGAGADETVLTNEWQDLVRFSNVVNARVSGFTLRDAGRGDLWPKEWINSADLNNKIGVALDALDRPHFCSASGGYLHYTYWNGASWVSENLAINGTPFGCSIRVAADGYPHIAYVRVYESSPFVNAMEVRYSYQDAFGWHHVSLASGGADMMYHNYDTALYLNASGMPVIFYTTTGFGLHYQTWDGTSWTDQAVGSENGYSLDLAVDSLGRPHLSYNSYDRASVRHAYWDGSAWQIEVVATGFLAFTSIALDSQDRPSITYVRWEGARQLDYAHFDGASWSVQALPGSTGAFSDNSIQIDSQDRPHIVYNIESSGDLRYSYWDGNNWVNLDAYDNSVPIGYYNDMELNSQDLPVIGAYHYSQNALYAVRYLGDPGARSAVRVRDSSGITIDHNRILSNRVGIYLSDFGSARAEFNTLVGHTFDAVRSSGHGSWLDFENNIVFGFTNGLRTADSGVILNDYNLIENSAKAYVDDGGTGIAQSLHEILAPSAGFQDPAAENYHLQQTSLGVDSADPLMPVDAGGGVRADLGYAELFGAPALILLGRENISTTTGYSSVQAVEYGLRAVDDAGLPVEETLPENWSSLALNPIDRAIAFWQIPNASLADGLYRVYSRAADAVGNEEEEPNVFYEGSFIIDSIPPVVVMETGSGTLDAPFQVRASAADYDALGQFTVKGIWFIVENGSIAVYAAQWEAEPWDPESLLPRRMWAYLDLAPGSYQIQAMVEDNAGNLTVTSAITIQVDAQNTPDATPPSLSISEPANEEVFVEDIHFAGQASDGESGLASVEVSMDGGYTWLPCGVQTDGSWSLDLKAAGGLDYTTFPVRVRARDRAGNQATQSLRVIVDNLGPRDYGPVTFSIPEGGYLDSPGDITVTWRQPRDGSGQAATVLVADQNPDTEPQLGSKSLSEVQSFTSPGLWYIHLGVIDPSGSKLYQHYGPWVVGNMQAACAERQQAIAVDGYIQTGLNEWNADELLDSDERLQVNLPANAAYPPAHQLYIAWDSDQLLLGFRGAWWQSDGTLWAFVDNAAGGSTQSPLASFSLPFEADIVVQIEDESSATLFTWNGASWAAGALDFAQSSQGDTEASLPFALPCDQLKLLVVVVNDQNSLSSAFPTSNLLEEPPSHYYSWSSLCDIGAPAAGQASAQTIGLSLSSAQAADTQWGPGQNLDYTLTITSFENKALSDLHLTLTASEGLTIQSINGADCLDCPPGGNSWQISIPALASLAKLDLNVRTQTQASLGELRQVTLGAALTESNLAEAQFSHRVDGIPPEVWLNPLPGLAVHTGMQILSGSATDQDGSGVAKVEVQLPGSSNWLTAFGTTAWNIDAVIPNLPLGYRVRMRASDAAGNLSPENEMTLLPDRVAPSASIAPPALVGGHAVAQIPGTAQDTYPREAEVRQVQVQIDHEGAPWLSALVYSPKSKGLIQEWQFTWGLPIEDYLPHRLRARAIDAAGNVGEPCDWLPTMVDTVAPQVIANQLLSEILVSDYQAGGSRSPVLNGSISDNGGVASLGVWLYAPSGLAAFTALNPGGTSWEFAPLLESDETGDFSLWVEAFDRAGNRRLTGPFSLIVTDQSLSGLEAHSQPNPALTFTPVEFNATLANGTNAAFVWDFGDGQSAQGQNVTHTYTLPGSYSVSVLAFNPVNSQSASLIQVIEEAVVPNELFLPTILR